MTQHDARSGEIPSVSLSPAMQRFAVVVGALLAVVGLWLAHTGIAERAAHEPGSARDDGGVLVGSGEVEIRTTHFAVPQLYLRTFGAARRVAGLTTVGLGLGILLAILLFSPHLTVGSRVQSLVLVAGALVATGFLATRIGASTRTAADAEAAFMPLALGIGLATLLGAARAAAAATGASGLSGSE